MAACGQCGEQADELVNIGTGNKRQRLCAECLEQHEEEAAIAAEAEQAMRQMMEYKSG